MHPDTDPVLLATIRAAFRRFGVVRLTDVLSREWMNEAFDAWSWSHAHPGPLASGLLPGTDDAFQDLCNPQAAPHYARLVHESPLADIAQALWQSSNVWFMYEQVFRKAGAAVGRTPWHQDTSYLAVEGPHLIAFWLSFEPIDEAHALEFVRGSHLGPLYNTSRFDPVDPTAPIFESNDLPRLPDIEADRSAHDIVRFATEPGDVIAFHTSMLHGGGPVSAAAPQRRTLTLRFFGDEAFSARRPGPAGPFFEDIRHLTPGTPFRHDRFPHVRGN